MQWRPTIKASAVAQTGSEPTGPWHPTPSIRAPEVCSSIPRQFAPLKNERSLGSKFASPEPFQSPIAGPPSQNENQKHEIFTISIHCSHPMDPEVPDPAPINTFSHNFANKAQHHPTFLTDKTAKSPDRNRSVRAFCCHAPASAERESIKLQSGIARGPGPESTSGPCLGPSRFHRWRGCGIWRRLCHPWQQNCCERAVPGKYLQPSDQSQRPRYALVPPRRRFHACEPLESAAPGLRVASVDPCT